MFEINLDLIKKYDKPGPRYTSYPPATHFHESFTPKDFIDELIKTNLNPDTPDLSLYFHLPYCDSLCYFCGCNTLITRERNRIEWYLSYLKREIQMIRSYIASGRKVVQLHWGGGTPTYLSPYEIKDLSAHIRSNFEFKDDYEAGCEIDPRELTRDHLTALKDSGFNRISMGDQRFKKP
jgi:oxygen-independent coproporphyrinogen-3 oxidase